MGESLRYALGYWWNVAYVAGGHAFAAIGWQHPRNAILPTLVSIASAAWVGYEQQDLRGFETRAMIAGAAFATFIGLFFLAFVWQMIGTPPRLEAEQAKKFGEEIEPLKTKVAGLESQIKQATIGDEQRTAERAQDAMQIRLAGVQGTLQKYADEAPGEEKYSPAGGAAWWQGAHAMVEDLVPGLAYKLGGFPHGGDYNDLRRAVGRLRTIAGDIRPEHLRRYST